MGMLTRKAFPLGWTPDADAADAPVGSLLRADNMVLDELDILSLRLGSTRINDDDPFPDLEVHSLHTQYLSGVRYRMVGAGNHVYANGTQLPQIMDSTGDIPFGTHMGQIFYARGTTRLKYDGTTVRNWGIEMTGGQPTIGVAAVSGTVLEIASCDLGESPAFVWEEDDGTGAGYSTGQDGTPNGALVVNPGANTRGMVAKIYPTDQNFNNLGGGAVADDDSVLSLYVFIADPTKVFSISLNIGVGETLAEDRFVHSWFAVTNPDGEALGGTLVAGWNRLQVRRGDMFRDGNTFGRGWNTIRSIRLFTQGFVGGTDAQVIFDNVTITGGLDSGLTGEYEFRYVYVRDDGSYIIRSAPSVSSISESGEMTQFTAQAAEITVPIDLDRDGQINQIWVFRRGGELPDWLRTVVYDGVITSGAITIIDDTTDEEALEIDILLEEDNVTPPNDIIGIEGPYYDRLWVLTATHLHMSRRLSPDTFSTSQVIRVAGPDETPLWVKKAFGGLYVGTTKDIYRIDGTAAELPDGTIEVDFRPLSIDNPPRNEAVAQEGSLLCYMAADGWRAFTGAGSQLLVGNTSLLYRGQDRHGIEAVNIATGRFRAAIAKSQLAAITPEGDFAASSTVQYRYSFTKQRWYRFTYAPNWLSIFREPDGTLIAGDDAGTVWTLDVGDSDDTGLIPVTIWTPCDGDGNSHIPKEVTALSIGGDTGGNNLTVDIHLDESEDSAFSEGRVVSFTDPAAYNIHELALCHLIQLRLTGNFNRFRLSSYIVNYVGLPLASRAWDSGPMDIGQQDLVWIRRIRLKARAGGTITVTPYFDGIAFDPVTVAPDASEIDRVTLLDAAMGRGFFGKVLRLIVTSDNDFHLFWVEPLIRRTTEATEKESPRIPSGLGGEAQA